MKSVSRLLVAATLLVLPASALAGTKSIDFNKSDLGPTGTATVDTDMSILLEEGSAEGAQVSFVLPKNFKKNSAAKVRLIFAGFNAAACNYQLDTDDVFRDRVGSNEANSIDPAETGFAATSAGPTPFPGSPEILVFAKNYNLKKPTGLSVNGQKAGDIITVEVVRDGTSVADTCTGSLWVVGGKLIYTTP